ncbi:MAG: hypothetical protein WCC04_16340 [Terriglobales bacterium]
MLKPTKRTLAVALVAALALLTGLRQPSPKEVVTHRICYPNANGTETCE